MIFHFFIFLRGKIPVRVTAPRFETTCQRQKVSKLPTEPPGLFLTFNVLLVVNPKKLLHGGQSRSWSAVQGKENKIKESSSAPPNPQAARSEKKKKHATYLQALRRFRSVSRPHKDSFDSSTRSRVLLRQNTTLFPFAITSFPVSFLLSSPGDV